MTNSAAARPLRKGTNLFCAGSYTCISPWGTCPIMNSPALTREGVADKTSIWPCVNGTAVGFFQNANQGGRITSYTSYLFTCPLCEDRKMKCFPSGDH